MYILKEKERGGLEGETYQKIQHVVIWLGYGQGADVQCWGGVGGGECGWEKVRNEPKVKNKDRKCTKKKNLKMKNMSFVYLHLCMYDMEYA